MVEARLEPLPGEDEGEGVSHAAHTMLKTGAAACTSDPLPVHSIRGGAVCNLVCFSPAPPRLRLIPIRHTCAASPTHSFCCCDTRYVDMRDTNTRDPPPVIEMISVPLDESAAQKSEERSRLSAPRRLRLAEAG